MNSDAASGLQSSIVNKSTVLLRGFEPRMLDSKSRVITTSLQEISIYKNVELLSTISSDHSLNDIVRVLSRKYKMIPRITSEKEIQKRRSTPGIEPGTSSTLKMNHTPRPSGLLSRKLPLIITITFYYLALALQYNIDPCHAKLHPHIIYR